MCRCCVCASVEQVLDNCHISKRGKPHEKKKCWCYARAGESSLQHKHVLHVRDILHVTVLQEQMFNVKVLCMCRLCTQVLYACNGVPSESIKCNCIVHMSCAGIVHVQVLFMCTVQVLFMSTYYHSSTSRSCMSR